MLLYLVYQILINRIQCELLHILFIYLLTLHKECYCYKVSETLTVLCGDGEDISVTSHHPHYCETEDIVNQGGHKISHQTLIMIIMIIYHNSGYVIFFLMKKIKTLLIYLFSPLLMTIKKSK